MLYIVLYKATSVLLKLLKTFLELHVVLSLLLSRIIYVVNISSEKFLKYRRNLLTKPQFCGIIVIVKDMATGVGQVLLNKFLLVRFQKLPPCATSETA